MNPIIITLFLGAGFIVLFSIGELLYHKLKVKAEYTRKYTHITVGILAMTFPIYFESHWQVLALTVIFFIILIVAKRYNQLQHIHAVPRVTYGSYLYPPTVYLCFLLGNKYSFGLFFYIPILVMAVSDPVAAITGSNWGRSITKKKNSKTFLGSLMFLVSAVIATFIIQFSIPEVPIQSLIFVSLLVGFVGMLAEVLSYKGWDNFTIPLAIVLLMFILRHFELV